LIFSSISNLDMELSGFEGVYVAMRGLIFCGQLRTK